MKRHLILLVLFFLSFTACDWGESPGNSTQDKPAIGSQFSTISYLPKISEKVDKDSYSGRVIVVFGEGTQIRLRKGVLKGLQGENLESFSKVLVDLEIKTINRLFRDQPETEIDENRKKLEHKTGKRLIDLNLFFEIPVENIEKVEQLIEQLKRLDEVALVYPEYRPIPPAATPDFEGLQGYLDVAPGGIDARHAWGKAGGDGTGITIIDLENGWNFDHEDLPLTGADLLSGNNSAAASDRNHGTAVAGELVGRRNGFGVTGISYGASLKVVSWSSQSAATAIEFASNAVSAGDVLLLEGQIRGPSGNTCTSMDQSGCVPMEWQCANYAAILNATAAGRIVIEAAGNGGQNLDDPIFQGAFDIDGRKIAGCRGLPSGAVIVGAGDPSTHQSAGFSNYANRVDLQGWGWSVTTTGYGNLFDEGVTRQYTSGFGGTSSASPIVAGAFACMRGISLAKGQPLSGPQILNAFKSTGTPQLAGDSHHIGPLPNLKAALAFFYNGSPIAEAGPNQNVNGGSLVQLNGNGSSDPDGDRLTFSWSQTAGPAVVLNNPNLSTPSFTAPLVNATVTMKLTVSDGFASSSDTMNVVIVVTDKDGDGLNDSKEAALGTDPNNPDTDGDGLKDGEEVNLYRTNPLSGDTDGDGLKDGEEVKAYGTDPLKVDSDGDGLNDKLEVLTSTNPAKADTDGDGLNDGQEDKNKNGAVDAGETDPRKADTDGDGLNDGDEAAQGTNPLKSDSDGDGLTDGDEVHKYKTNPLKADTDGDGLNDGAEILQYGTNPLLADTDSDGLSDGLEVSTKTNPKSPDTDGDTLLDGLEDKNHNGLVDLGETDPRVADTDGDGIDDGEEVRQGTDPTKGDTDGDGLNDGLETKTGTNPLSDDTDKDGLKDGDEDKNKNGAVDLGETDPRKADTDGDGLNDGLEVRTATDPLKEDTDGDTLKDGEEDLNLDGAVNGNETDPRKADTDGDGLDDGLEVRTKTNPISDDTDTDGLKDGQEDKNRNGVVDPGETDPRNSDSDGDSLNDGLEVKTGTDPVKADTDGDTLSDGDEDKNKNGSVDSGETDPRKFDTDGDGLNDGEEINTYHTDPLKPDTDGDGLTDKEEVSQYHTNPLKPDTDDDGLNDREEVIVFHTDPNNPDTDGDTLSDGDEVHRHHTNPLDKNTDHDCFDDNIEVATPGRDPTLYDDPILAFDSTPVDLGDVNRRGKETFYVIRNRGILPLDIQNARISGNGYSMGNVSSPILSGREIRVPVLFSPVLGEQQGQVNFETNDCTNPAATLNLRANGLISRMAAAPLDIDFGKVPVLTHQTKNVTLSNPDSNRPIFVTLATDDPAFYPLRLSAKIAPGASIQIPIAFRPYRYGTFSGNLHVGGFYGQDAQGIDIALHGVGDADAPNLTLSQGALDFGLVSVGSSGFAELKVRNNGRGRLFVHRIQVMDQNGQPMQQAGGPYDWILLPGLERFTVEAGRERKLKVRFQPQGSGQISGSLKIVHNAGGDVTVPFQGEGR